MLGTAHTYSVRRWALQSEDGGGGEGTGSQAAGTEQGQGEATDRQNQGWIWEQATGQSSWARLEAPEGLCLLPPAQSTSPAPVLLRPVAQGPGCLLRTS